MKKSDSILFAPVMLIIILAVVAFCSSAKSQETNLAPYTSLVEVVMPGGQSFGTGTLVVKSGDDGLILTARHVALQQGDKVQLNWLSASGQLTAGVTMKVVPGDSYADDMALVVGKVPAGIKPVNVAKFNTANGPWLAAGYRDRLLRVGGPYNVVTKTRADSLYINSPLVHGQSGGALFDRSGNVVGVIIASNCKDWAICSDGAYLERLLAEYMQIR